MQFSSFSIGQEDTRKANFFTTRLEKNASFIGLKPQNKPSDDTKSEGSAGDTHTSQSQPQSQQQQQQPPIGSVGSVTSPLSSGPQNSPLCQQRNVSPSDALAQETAGKDSTTNTTNTTGNSGGTEDTVPPVLIQKTSYFKFS